MLRLQGKAHLEVFLFVIFASLNLGARQWKPLGSPTEAEEVYADGVRLTKKAPQTYLVTWTAYKADPDDPCAPFITYSVYRGTTEDFDPSP